MKPLDRERALPVKGRLRHAQLGLRRGDPCGRGVKIGLLLGRIEPGQEVAGIDVGADVHKPREDASAHPERQVGTEAGLDLAGQRYGSLSVPRLHKLSVHQRGTLDRSGGRGHCRHQAAPPVRASANTALMGLGIADAGGWRMEWCTTVLLELNYTV